MTARKPPASRRVRPTRTAPPVSPRTSDANRAPGMLDGLGSTLRPEDLGGACPVPPAPKRGRGSAPTRPQWEAMLDFYRRSPGDVPGAGRAAGVSPYIARKAWREGWEGEYPALDGFLAEEAEEAEKRAASARRADARAAQEAAGLAEARRALEAREAAVKSREAAGKVIEFGRANVLLTFNALVPVLRALQVEVPRIEGAIKTMTPVEILRALRLMQGIVARGVEAGRLLMDMDKLHAGNAAPLAEVPMGRDEMEAELAELRGLLGDHAGAARELLEEAAVSADTPEEVRDLLEAGALSEDGGLGALVVAETEALEG